MNDSKKTDRMATCLITIRVISTGVALMLHRTVVVDTDGGWTVEAL